MFHKTRQLLRGLSATLKLAWLLLVAGMLLFIPGMLPLGWPIAWAGVGCLLLGLVIATFSSSHPEDPASTDRAFRSAIFSSALLTPTAGLLLLTPVIALCGVVVGLFAGFDLALFFVCLRMLLMALVFLFVTGIPAYSSVGPRRPAPR